VRCPETQKSKGGGGGIPARATSLGVFCNHGRWGSQQWWGGEKITVPFPGVRLPGTREGVSGDSRRLEGWGKEGKVGFHDAWGDLKTSLDEASNCL